MWKKISRRLRRMSYVVSLLSTVYSASLVLQSTMSPRSLSSFFSSPVQPPPRAKREDLINAVLYFRFKDRITGRKRQEAYNEAQKACATLFLSVPMATLCKFVAMAQQMGTLIICRMSPIQVVNQTPHRRRVPAALPPQIQALL